EEQSSKYWDYLSCFLASSGSEDDAKKCLDTVKIDKTKLNTCISSGKGKEYYEVDKKLSEQYGVQGSPT
ncbi:DsbA family protein, partial [Brachyspira hyodysenteriae]|uniref:DsbA family protein n=1 Tax=Brachyspira hyodysenteriae TaxID=159 RepID=UPI001A7E0954